MSAPLRCAVAAVACLGAAAPRFAAAVGFGNAAPVVAAPTFSADPIPAGGAVTVTCSATDDGQVAVLTVSVTGGTLENGTQTQSLAIVPAASATASVAWTTPAAPGTFTVTCTATDGGGDFGAPPATGSASASVTTVVTALPPVVRIVQAPAAPVVAGTTVLLAAEGTDPQGGALTWSWTASGGAVAPDGATAAWTAPATGGAFTVTATATGAAGLSGAASVSIAVVLAGFQGSLAAEMVAPMRVAAGPTGDLYAVDGREGRVLLLTARGEPKGAALVNGRALSVAAGPGVLLVATAEGRLLEIDPATGRGLREIPLQGGPLGSPLGIAFEPSRSLVWVAERGRDAVRAVRLDGTTAFTLGQGGAAPLLAPVDVAVDPAGRVLVALEKGKASLDPGDPPELAHVVHAFDPDGAHLASFVRAGSAAAETTRTGGLAVGPGGRVLLADIFQSRVQVHDASGAHLGSLGGFGFDAGQLRNPAGVAALADGVVAVANADAGRIERFAAGNVPLPTCPGDADCDGLPDAWESANGMNPAWAGDALLDADGDGLLAVEERAHGTDPGNADTDSDGARDLDEIASGFDPLDPTDHVPALVASNPPPQGPGLARFAAAVQGVGDCSVAWTQVGGPAVSLQGAGTLSPSFVARQAAVYRFQGLPSCRGLPGTPGTVGVTIENVAPRADAGRIAVVQTGKTLSLSGAASSDANGDALTLAWDQLLGPPVLGPTSGPAATIRVHVPGYYLFRLGARDPAGAEGEAEAAVLVLGDDVGPTAVVSTPVLAEVGASVALDASGSYRNQGATFAWSQREGPPVALAGGGGAIASFVAAEPGRYVFEVAVLDGPFRSPPARIEAYVAEAVVPPPVARAAAPEVVPVNLPLELDGSASTGAGGLTYAWRQVSGPAAGLTGADRAVATVVPFAAGSYQFELSVVDGRTHGQPARVRFEARAGGTPIPVAVAWAPGLASVGQLVLLDGRGSQGASRWRWTQVDGPWVPIFADRSAATFRPLEAGLYAFELEVEGGGVRSAPARVNVLVLPAGGTP
ncbi:MAG TPA: hypothetical protein VLS93_12180 [Anaeromyxobacteraceae bacterium]|nr:hypothetical protein [Anaeromyxobacteraceae bacterium]